MKTNPLSMLVVFAGFLASTGLAAVTIDRGSYTIGMSHDGNQHDKDDYVASAMGLALLGEADLKDHLVHFDYSCHLGNNNATQAAAMNASVTGALGRWGYNFTAHDDQTDLTGAINSIKTAVNNSTSAQPFYFCCAGPMEVAYRGVSASTASKRINTTVVSHSSWNNNHSDTSQMTHDWTDLKNLGVKSVLIAGQNDHAFNSSYASWQWLSDKGRKYRWLFNRSVKSTFDASDAGMVWYVITGRGDDTPAMTDIQQLFNGQL